MVDNEQHPCHGFLWRVDEGIESDLAGVNKKAVKGYKKLAKCKKVS